MEVDFKSMALNEITVGVSEDWEEEQGLTPKAPYIGKMR